MKLLSRDELQGVIGHEFSHILNGDMRLNMRLTGIIFGIICLAVIGRILLFARGGSPGSQRTSHCSVWRCFSLAGSACFSAAHSGRGRVGSASFWRTPRPCNSRATRRESPGR